MHAKGAAPINGYPQSLPAARDRGRAICTFEKLGVSFVRVHRLDKYGFHFER
jgi:hypothetical protein